METGCHAGGFLTGSDLMKCGDRMFQKGYNGFIKVGIWRRFLFIEKRNK